MALVFAVVGFYQYETRTIFENAKLNQSNVVRGALPGQLRLLRPVDLRALPRGRADRYGSPDRRPRAVVRASIAALAFCAVVWLGLLISFSQSSFAALLVAMFALAAIVWRWKSLLALAAVLVVAAGIAVTQPISSTRCATTRSRRAQQGHERAVASLIAVGIKIAKRTRRTASVSAASSMRTRSGLTRQPRQSASHNTPVTVAAEGGALGFLLFFWLVVALFIAAFRRIRHPVYGTLALATGLALVAIFVHSLAYNDFFEDPTTWVLIGLVGLVSPVRVRARERRAVETGEPVPEMIAG